MSDLLPTDEAFESGRGSKRPHGHADWPSFETLSAYVDRALGSSEERLVTAHLETCSFCRSIVTDIELLSSLIRSQQAPAQSRSFCLTVETPGIRLASHVPPAASAAPVSIKSRRLTPFRLFPYLTAIAAILLLAVVAGDMINRHDETTGLSSTTPSVLIIDGTAFTEEGSSSIQASGVEPTSQDATSADQSIGSNPVVAQPPIASKSTSSDRFWTGWRIAELLLGLTVVVLLVTMFRGRPFGKR